MSTLNITIDDLLEDVVKYRDERATGQPSPEVEWYIQGLDFAMVLVKAAFHRHDCRQNITGHRIVIDDFTRTARVVSE
jgi:hypothetical protein